LDYRSAAKEIGKGKFSPVYVCYGAEAYLMQEFIAYLTNQWIEPADREFAVSKFDLSESNVELAIEDAETPPFVGSRKLIIAKDAGFFTGAKDSSKLEHRIERLAEYLKSPVDFSIIVFTVNADKLDERKKLVKSVIELKGNIPFQAMSADDLTHWVRRQADKHKIVFEDGADQTLIQNCNGNLQAISGELSKLSIYAGAGQVVTRDSVDQLVARSMEQNIFLMIEEMVKLRLDKALAIYYELLKHKEEPIKILALMARQFRNMLLIKQLSNQGYTQQQLASSLSLHPYAVKIAADQARAYDVEKLKLAVTRLAEADYQMKTGQIDKVLALELFMLKLVS
jgi:DNA polymerase-3 subunit delta